MNERSRRQPAWTGHIDDRPGWARVLAFAAEGEAICDASLLLEASNYVPRATEEEHDQAEAGLSGPWGTGAAVPIPSRSADTPRTAESTLPAGAGERSGCRKACWSHERRLTAYASARVHDRRGPKLPTVSAPQFLLDVLPETSATPTLRAGPVSRSKGNAMYGIASGPTRNGRQAGVNCVSETLPA